MHQSKNQLLWFCWDLFLETLLTDRRQLKFLYQGRCAKVWLHQYDLWNNFFLQWIGEQNYRLSEMLIRSVGFVAIADDNMLLAGTGICWLTGVEMVTSGTDISTVCTRALGVDKTSCGCGWVFELRLSLEAAGLDDAYGDDEFLFDSCLQHFKAEGTLRL